MLHPEGCPIARRAVQPDQIDFIGEVLAPRVHRDELAVEAIHPEDGNRCRILYRFPATMLREDGPGHIEADKLFYGLVQGLRCTVANAFIHNAMDGLTLQWYKDTWQKWVLRRAEVEYPVEVFPDERHHLSLTLNTRIYVRPEGVTTFLSFRFDGMLEGKAKAVILRQPLTTS